jgi:hypothetical protein
VWHDEFETAIGPDWSFDIGTGTAGWGNNERQFYTARPENARVEHGALVIEARREQYSSSEYTSARLKTEGRAAFTYGRIEARIQIPRGEGLWPAFWALGDDMRVVGWPRCGEIDVMENIGREPGRVHATVHGPGYSGNSGVGGFFDLPSGAFADGFHLFAVEWDASACCQRGRYSLQVDHAGGCAWRMGVRPSLLPAAQPCRGRPLAGRPENRHAIPGPDEGGLRSHLQSVAWRKLKKPGGPPNKTRPPLV